MHVADGSNIFKELLGLMSVDYRKKPAPLSKITASLTGPKIN